ncbi:MAG: DUF4143 domain-containing protein [Fusobacteriaceae bacterium]|jgi:predicted AAA+ superfamily ATPase|nr:DUF4143 domain-containing protein [Fusobacteriaceae bacterium]
MKKQYDRLLEKYLKDLLADLPAVAIDGLKGVGKTVSASRIANTVYKLDRESDFLLISNDPGKLSSSKTPVLIDEWQKIPKIWDYVRRDVDDRRDDCAYLLTGSISAKNLDVHSGAGRIARLRMFPLSLEERGLARKTVSLETLLDQREAFSTPIQGQTTVSFGDYIEEMAVSGLPGMRIANERRRKLAFDSYLNNLLTHDFEQEGIRIRQPEALKRWLSAYAAAVSTSAKYEEILDAATPREGNKPAIKTTIAYREALERMWLIDELPIWTDGADFCSRMKKAPKHYLADPAFAIHLLGLRVDMLNGSDRKHAPDSRFDEKYGNIIGRLFEAFIFQSLRVYAGICDANLYHFQTLKGDREIDFILSRGRDTVAIEVKTAPFISDHDVRHLLWLKSRANLSDAVIITTGPLAYRRPDGIAVVPASLLGA